jgi:hypothetical protein
MREHGRAETLAKTGGVARMIAIGQNNSCHSGYFSEPG